MKYSILLILLIMSSCSTLSKSKTWGALTGALICAPIGHSLGGELSPDKESTQFNKSLGTAIGISTCATIGYFLGKNLYESDYKNKEYAPLKIDEYQNFNNKQFNLNDIEPIK